MKRAIAILAILLPLAASAQQAVRVNNSTKIVTEPTSFWSSNVTPLSAALASIYQPLDSDLTDIAAVTTDPYGRGFLIQTSKNEALTFLGIPFDDVPQTGWEEGDMPVWNVADTFFTKAPSTSYGRGFLSLANKGEGLSALGIPFEEIPSESPWPADYTIYWDGAQFVATPFTSLGRDIAASTSAEAARTAIGLPLSETPVGNWGFGSMMVWGGDYFYPIESGAFGRSFLETSDAEAARNTIGLGTTDGATFAWLYAGGINLEENVITIPADGNITLDGNTFKSLFDGSGGSVLRAQNAEAGWDGSFYTVFGSAAFAGVPFYPSGDYSGDGLTAQSANYATSAGYDGSGTYYLTNLFDGSGGYVFTAEQANYATASMGGGNLDSLFDTTGGAVAFAQTAYTSETAGSAMTAYTAQTIAGANAFSSSVTVSVDYFHSSLTGTTAGQTATLPSPNGGGFLIIKNRSSQSWTIASNSGSQIYTTSAVATVTLVAGASLTIASDGTYWNVIN